MSNKLALKIIVFLGITGLLKVQACSAGGPGSAKPGDVESGLCSLNCDNAIIASNDSVFSITPEIETANISCFSPGQEIPIRMKFLVSETYTVQETENRRPVPFISANFSSSFNIVTPEDQRCSDTCGVVLMDLVGTCPPKDSTATDTPRITSGALFTTDPPTITITSE